MYNIYIYIIYVCKYSIFAHGIWYPHPKTQPGMRNGSWSVPPRNSWCLPAWWHVPKPPRRLWWWRRLPGGSLGRRCPRLVAILVRGNTHTQIYIYIYICIYMDVYICRKQMEIMEMMMMMLQMMTNHHFLGCSSFGQSRVDERWKMRGGNSAFHSLKLMLQYLKTMLGWFIHNWLQGWRVEENTG